MSFSKFYEVDDEMMQALEDGDMDRYEKLIPAHHAALQAIKGVATLNPDGTIPAVNKGFAPGTVDEDWNSPEDSVYDAPG